MKKLLLATLLMIGIAPYTIYAEETQTVEEITDEFTRICRNLFQQFHIASAIGQAIQQSQATLNELKDKLVELGLTEDNVKELFESIMQELNQKAEEAAAAQAETEDAEQES